MPQTNRPDKNMRNLISQAMHRSDQNKEVMYSLAIDCINASTHAQNEVTDAATGSARTAASTTQSLVALAMNLAHAGRQVQSYEHNALQMLACKSSGPPPSQPVPKQLPWHGEKEREHQESAWRTHQKSAVWRAPQAGVWRAGVWQKHQGGVWEAPQEGALRAHQEYLWREPPPPVPRQDPGSVPQGCSVRRDGETSPPGCPGKPPALKALEKIDESTSADDGTACTCDPYMVPAAGSEVKKRRLTELSHDRQARANASTSKSRRLA